MLKLPFYEEAEPMCCLDPMSLHESPYFVQQKRHPSSLALRARQGIKQTCSQSALGGFGALRAEGFRPGLRVLTFPTDNSEPQQSTAGKIVTLQACLII